MIAQGAAHRIMLAAAEAAGCELSDLRSDSRLPIVAEARGVAAWLLYERLGLHDTQIARLLHRDRSTVIEARRRMREAIDGEARGERLTRTLHRRVLTLAAATTTLDAYGGGDTVGSLHALGRACLDAAARLDTGALEDADPAMLALMIESCARALAAHAMLDRAACERAQRTSPERVASPGALAAAAEEAATDDRQ